MLIILHIFIFIPCIEFHIAYMQTKCCWSCLHLIKGWGSLHYTCLWKLEVPKNIWGKSAILNLKRICETVHRLRRRAPLWFHIY